VSCRGETVSEGGASPNRNEAPENYSEGNTRICKGRDPPHSQAGGVEPRARAEDQRAVLEREETDSTDRGNELADSEIVVHGSRGIRAITLHQMASQKTPHRKSNEAENGSLVPIALARIFGEDEDIMEIDSPAQSLKKLLEEKAKNQTKGVNTREAG
jgi:hypothetical protein